MAEKLPAGGSSGGAPGRGRGDRIVRGDGTTVDRRAFLWQRYRVESRSEPRWRALRPVDRSRQRSEEHTSELQSLMRISYAVFCLKKKQYIISPDKLNDYKVEMHIPYDYKISTQRNVQM